MTFYDRLKTLVVESKKIIQPSRTRAGLSSKRFGQLPFR